jgi:hypothetical protein
MEAISHRLTNEHPETNTGLSLQLTPAARCVYQEAAYRARSRHAIAEALE